MSTSPFLPPGYPPPGFPSSGFPPPPAHVPAPPAGWTPPAPWGTERPRHSRLAITALVLSVLALLGTVGTGVVLLVVGVLATGGGPIEGTDDYTLLGTAGGVVTGHAYLGADLADEVQRVLENDYATVDEMTCPDTAVVDAGTETSCHGVVDGYDATVVVTFTDARGHFELVERY